MILRSVTQHVKAQNWTAVAIDFVIVVVGVFIGIQVANWNAAEVEARKLEQQLANLQIELEGNLDRINEYRQFASSQIEAINQLRAAFDDPAAADPDSVDANLFYSLRVFHLQPEMVAYQELVDTGGVRALANTPVREALTKWEFDLAWVQRIDRDTLEFRDDVVMPPMVELVSIAAIAEDDPQQTSVGFAPSRFRNDVAQLAESRQLENVLTVRFVMEAQAIYYVDILQQSTHDLIDALQARLAES